MNIFRKSGLSQNPDRNWRGGGGAAKFSRTCAKVLHKLPHDKIIKEMFTEME